MLSTYRALFRVDGAARFSLAGFVARLPISMTGIGTVLLVSATTGQYALAGLVAGTVSLVGAVGGPLTSRLVDRFGQARVLRPLLAINAVAAVALVLLVRSGAPTPTWFAAAALTGASVPNIGSLVRARWAAAVPSGLSRQTAFAFESVVDELVFVTGPPLVTALAIGVTPGAGLLAAVVFGLLGGLTLAGLRRTEPVLAAATQPHPSAREVMRPGLLVVALTFAGAGAVFGSIEVIVVAYSQLRGHPGAAGAILAAYAGGSLVAGLAYGVVDWHRSLASRFGLAAVVFGGAAVLPLTVRTLPLLAVVIFISGLSISPVLIAGNSLVESLMPPGALTEGLSWVSTGVIAGVTLGAATAGPLIDAAGAQRAFVIPAAAGLATVVVALIGRRWLDVGRSVMLEP